MRLGQVRSGEWSDASCAIMWNGAEDTPRILRVIPLYMFVKNNRICDKVRNIEHVLVAGCIVVVFKNGKVEVV